MITCLTCEKSLPSDSTLCDRCGVPIGMTEAEHTESLIAAQTADAELSDRVRAHRLSPQGKRERKDRAIKGMAGYSAQLNNYGK